ncbi:MAG: carbohydrate-binding protein [Desulfitobacteriaceae bacterium]|nr:carbohydrate-binding protein [Desulfitobacteriaceae bacterium]
MYGFSEHGIAINPMPSKIGEQCNIHYDGLLKKSGADQVYLHCGYGQSWSNPQDIPMFNTATGCACDITPLSDGTFNFCFKDSANNWDNNRGENWTVFIKR